MMQRIIGVLACWAAALTAHAQVDTFPRLGAVVIGGDRNYEDATLRAQIAKVDLAIMSVWPTWEAEHGMTMEEVVRRIKAINPNIKIFMYFLPESLRYPVNPAYADLGAKLDASKWWLYRTGSGPTKVLSDFGKDTYILNLTAFSPKDSSGKRLSEWLPGYAYEKKMKPNPSIDGIFTDNVFWKPRLDGDWNRDGTIDSQNSVTVQKYYREGNVTYLNGLKALMPGKIQIGNVADWGKPESVLTEYDQVLQGGVIEAIVGPTYSSEDNRGWSGMLYQYRKTMKALAAPKLGIFHQLDNKANFQSFRYGFASSLLDDGYYAFSDDDDGYSGVPWFDEFDVELGRATATPPVDAWQKGVWRRDFEHGIALVNPRGNGPVEVTLEGNFRKVTGSQDRAVNNGQLVSKVTLRDRDGIVLLRAKRRPRPPGGVKVTPSG